jgi:hypothetical protein
MVIDTKNVTIRIRDGTAVTPKEIIVKLGEGNLTYDERRNMEYIKDRGKLSTVREGDEEPIEVSLDAMWEELTTTGVSGSPAPTVEDAMKRRGPASAWVSTSADPCEPYAVDIVVEHDPECSGQMREIVVLPDFRWTSIAHDMNGGTLRFTGQSHATQANVSRAAQTA